MFLNTSIVDTLEYIHSLYRNESEEIPYIVIMFPDKGVYIMDPLTRYIYDGYGKKKRYGKFSTKILNKTNIEMSLHPYCNYIVEIYDFFTCGKNRLKFN
jgi:hypothetical protein